jgi:hypothetical protein
VTPSDQQLASQHDQRCGQTDARSVGQPGLFAGSMVGPSVTRRMPAGVIRVLAALAGLGRAVWLWVHPGQPTLFAFSPNYMRWMRTKRFTSGTETGANPTITSPPPIKTALANKPKFLIVPRVCSCVRAGDAFGRQ